MVRSRSVAFVSEGFVRGSSILMTASGCSLRDSISFVNEEVLVSLAMTTSLASIVPLRNGVGHFSWCRGARGTRSEDEALTSVRLKKARVRLALGFVYSMLCLSASLDTFGGRAAT